VTKKWGWGKREKQFSQKHEYEEQRMLGKKSAKNVRKHVSYIHTNIVTKKWGIKRAIQNFPEQNE